MDGAVVCPVCTLYLRPGMTLKSHLASHPKHKVIEALVKLHSDNEPDPISTAHTAPRNASNFSSNDNVNHPFAAQSSQGGGNAFIYQQFVTAPPNGCINQQNQFIAIPVFNHPMMAPGMMCPPYMYPPQTYPMTGGSRFLPIEEAQSSCPQIQEIIDDEQSDIKDDMVDEKENKEETSKKPKKNEAEAVTAQDQPPVLEINENHGEEDVLLVEDNQTSKSCQTANEEADQNEGPPQLHPEVIIEDEDSKKSYDGIECTPTYLTLTSHVDGETSSSHIAIDGSSNSNQNVQSNFDVDGMNLILGHEFISAAPLISAVEDFAYIRDPPRDLMNIGDFQDNRDENISIDSAHIRADEHMPPRGELSGQESNASDIAWPPMHYHEGSSGMSTSYDLLARETWDSSEGSDLDEPPYQSRDPLEKDDDMPTISGYSAPPITYKCNSCEETFVCPKERRVHQSQVHQQQNSTAKETKPNIIGSQLFKKNVKKLVIKPKPKTENISGESPFDQIFSNIMKLEEAHPQSENATVTSGSAMNAIAAAKSEKMIIPTAPQVVICVLCCNVVSNTQTLREHNVELHGFGTDVKYKCGTCGDAFTHEPKFIEHLMVHPLECQFCGKFFYRMHNMQLHIKRHLGIKQYMCAVCDKSFLTKQKLQEHTNVHTGLSPLKCNFCGECFKRHSNLVQHRNRHHLQLKRKYKDYICFCGEVFHSKKKLEWHKEIHENKPKSCSYCSEKFVHLSSLTRHVRKAHNERYIPGEDRDSENVECPICKGIYLRSSLDQHIKNHSGTKNFTCSICDKDFSTKWNLKLHKWTHAARNAKPFKCEHCKGAFVRETDYIAHMNSHKQIRPYTCNYCGAKFIRKYNCQRHVKEHERGKTFTCTVCSKTFHRSYYLQDHMRIHSGIRPHSCHICGKTSTTKSNHNKHIKIHHAREPVTTEN